jgi:glycosyltransferase involved in cell wall biosynthesis
MRFHVLALPHTVTRKDYSACAFTQKVLKWCKMMTERGHTVYHYGHKDSEVVCTEHIAVTFNEDLKIAYGDHDWRKNFFKHNTSDHAHQIFNQRAIIEVGVRKQKNDFILCFWGYAHKPIFQAHPELIPVEPGIGCTNEPCCPQNIFESYSVMNQVYGQYKRSPHWYDAVIPNYFDPEDFEFNDKPEDYYLFVGRIIGSKGIGIAVDVTKRLGAKLLVAGQGDFESVVGPLPDHVKLIGYVEPKERCDLMKNAKALFAPTHFNEPFGGVMVEALFCGTPVITTDWGGFAENNLHGVTGYRCRTMEQFVWAAKNIDNISRKACHEWAMKNFSLQRIALMYEEYFSTLLKIHTGNGFYDENPDRSELDWLVRYYPETITREPKSPSPLLIAGESQSCDVPEFHSKPSQEKEDVVITSQPVSEQELTSTSQVPSNTTETEKQENQEPHLSIEESNENH